MTLSTLNIRPSIEADMTAVAAIYAHHVRHGTASFETEPPELADMLGRRSALLERDMPHLVAERDGQILGYAYAGPYRARAAYRHTVENSVYIHPDAIGQGVGRALLTALIAACEARGLRQMIAVVGGSDHMASIRLHETLGFQMVGVLKAVGHKHGAWRDTVLLQRSLGPGDGEPPPD